LKRIPETRNQKLDLLDVFEKGKTNSYFWTEKNNYKYYYPFEKNGKKMLLLFSKY